MKTETKIKNVKLQLGTLQQERAEEANKLTSAIKERDEVLLYISNKIKDFEALESKLEVLNGKLNIERKATKDEILKREGIIKSAKNELKDIHLEKNKQIKKLEGLNFRIINAEKRIDDLIEIKGSYKITEIDIEKLKKIENEVKERASNIAKENIALTKINKLLSIDNSKKIEGFNKTVENKEEQLKELETKIAQAKNSLDQLNFEARRTKKDCDIYVRRAEKVYSTAFPKLKMKII